MAVGHRDYIKSIAPEAKEKLFLLKSFDSPPKIEDIKDPIGLSADVYKNIRDEIDRALPGLVDFMRHLD